jgi:hypothetical protein
MLALRTHLTWYDNTAWIISSMAGEENGMGTKTKIETDYTN